MEQLSQQFEQLSSSSPATSAGNNMNKRRGNSLSECSISTTISSASSLTSSVSSETGIAAYYGDYQTSLIVFLFYFNFLKEMLIFLDVILVF
jgi:hypothetical protein